MQESVQKTIHIERAEGGTREDRRMKRVFLTPTIIILLALSIFPLLWSLGISFTDVQRGAVQNTTETGEIDEGFLGLGFHFTFRNYGRMVEDERLHTAARNTLVYVLAGVTIQYIIGFGLALVLNEQFIGRKLARVIFLMPMMMTPVAVAYTGRMLFDASLSPLAQLQRTITRVFALDPALSVPWLTDGRVAPITIILVDSWQWIPFMTLVLLAGLQAIPEEIYEAARVDGASALHILRKITFPLLLPISATVILIRGLEIFKIIDVINVMTGGGPGSSTESLTMYIYKTTLTFGNYGYASAISYVLLILVILFATFFLMFVRRASPAAGR